MAGGRRQVRMGPGARLVGASGDQAVSNICRHADAGLAGMAAAGAALQAMRRTMLRA